VRSDDQSRCNIFATANALAQRASRWQWLVMDEAKANVAGQEQDSTAETGSGNARNGTERQEERISATRIPPVPRPPGRVSSVVPPPIPSSGGVSGRSAESTPALSASELLTRRRIGAASGGLALLLCLVALALGLHGASNDSSLPDTVSAALIVSRGLVALGLFCVGAVLIRVAERSLLLHGSGRPETHRDGR